MSVSACAMHASPDTDKINTHITANIAIGKKKSNMHIAAIPIMIPIPSSPPFYFEMKGFFPSSFFKEHFVLFFILAFTITLFCYFIKVSAGFEKRRRQIALTFCDYFHTINTQIIIKGEKMTQDYWDKYVNDILEELGGADWSDAEKNDIQIQISEALQTKLMADITIKLNSAQKLALKTMLTEDKTPVQIINFLYSIRPDITKIVEISIQEFKQELLS